VTETPDPLAGSYFVETLTTQLEEAAQAYLDEIDAMGGTLAAIEGGFQQRQIQESAYRVQQAIERGDLVVVGVNRFRDDEVTTPALHRIDPNVVKADFKRAGFQLVATSDMLRNPADDHTLLVFDPKIRGKTDRFVFKFRKPR